jgi:hypothetical protein
VSSSVSPAVPSQPLIDVIYAGHLTVALIAP